MSHEHNFCRTNEICYQGKAGQVHQLKVYSFFSPLTVNGPVLLKMIDFIISSFIKVLHETVAWVIRTTETDSAWMSKSGTLHFSISDSSLWVFWPHPLGTTFFMTFKVKFSKSGVSCYNLFKETLPTWRTDVKCFYMCQTFGKWLCE